MRLLEYHQANEIVPGNTPGWIVDRFSIAMPWSPGPGLQGVDTTSSGAELSYLPKEPQDSDYGEVGSPKTWPIKDDQSLL